MGLGRQGKNTRCSGWFSRATARCGGLADFVLVHAWGGFVHVRGGAVHWVRGRCPRDVGGLCTGYQHERVFGSVPAPRSVPRPVWVEPGGRIRSVRGRTRLVPRRGRPTQTAKCPPGEHWARCGIDRAVVGGVRGDAHARIECWREAGTAPAGPRGSDWAPNAPWASIWRSNPSYRAPRTGRCGIRAR
jgi:hypothetical protein